MFIISLIYNALFGFIIYKILIQILNKDKSILPNWSIFSDWKDKSNDDKMKMIIDLITNALTYLLQIGYNLLYNMIQIIVNSIVNGIKELKLYESNIVTEKIDLDVKSPTKQYIESANAIDYPNIVDVNQISLTLNNKFQELFDLPDLWFSHNSIGGNHIDFKYIRELNE